MKFYYAGDNRNRSNWGCRATSMALGALILECGSIVGTSMGSETASFSCRPTPFGGVFPARFARIVSRLSPSKLRSRLTALLEWTGTHFDFIEEDPSASVERFLSIKNSYWWLAQLYAELNDADALVINGEGSMIFATPPRRDALFFLFLIELATRLGKKTYYINAMVSDCPRSGRNLNTTTIASRVLKQCTAISTRDPDSLDLLHQLGVANNSHFIPDALFTWSIQTAAIAPSLTYSSRILEPFGDEEFRHLPSLDLNEPYLCLGGSSSAAWTQREAIDAYKRLASHLLGIGLPLLVVPTCDGDRFLTKVAEGLGLPMIHSRVPIRLGAAVLAKAAAFVSGRFHPSILASGGGTPCILMGSNSHKCLSLQRLLDFDSVAEFPALPDETACREIVAATRSTLARGESLRLRIAGIAAKRALEAETIKGLLLS